MNEEVKRVFDAFDTLGTTEAYVFSYKVRGEECIKSTAEAPVCGSNL